MLALRHPQLREARAVSIKLMSAVWELDLPTGEKMVLLALADQANDAGEQCWPSVPTIARRCGMGDRTVRRALADLEAAGHLTRLHRDGNSTQYRVHPGHSGSPAKSAALPNTPKTPAKLAAKPSGTISSPPVASQPTERRERKRPPSFVPPSDIPEPEWEAFEEMRRRIGKPMTARARELAVERLRRLAEDGHPPGAVLNHSILNNYQGLFPPKEDRNEPVRSSRGTAPAGRVDGFGNALREMGGYPAASQRH